jgi:hypothetical protein
MSILPLVISDHIPNSVIEIKLMSNNFVPDTQFNSHLLVYYKPLQGRGNVKTMIGEKLGPELWARVLSLHTSITKKEQTTSLLARTRARF